MDLAKVYPYVVPVGYIELAPGGPDGFVVPVGHDLFALPVHDLDGLCRNVLPDELAAAGLGTAALHQRALDNLEALAKGPDIHKSMHQGPGGMPFVVWSGHWLTASCLRLSGLYAFASRALKADAVCVSVPHREAMLVFPVGTREQRDQMRAIIRENEADAPKPLTWELFTLSAAGLRPLPEE
jgi:hypothetical protein